mgnify:FL=1
MKAANDKILVKVDLKQKNKMLIGDVLFSTALKYDTNYREKSPVMAEVVQGNKFISKGDILLCHHNMFYLPSPHHIQDDIFSIKFNNRTVFAKVLKNGRLSAICGNVLGERVIIPSNFDVPPEFKKSYTDRLKITDKGWTTFKNGTTVLCRPNAPYDIVYNFNNKEIRVTKLDSEQILGYIKE